MKTSHIKLKKLALITVFIGAINWGLVAFNYNAVELFDKYIPFKVSKLIYILVALSALYLMFDRNLYLPFLGNAVYPCGSLTNSIPKNADTHVKIHTNPNSVVIYWAAENGDAMNRGYKQAYRNYANYGVSMSDENGIAVLSVRKPVGYQVHEKQLNAHIHYRICLGGGMLSEVKTISV